MSEPAVSGNKAWVKGMKSPNPKGRPKGIVDRRAKITESMLTDASDIVEAVVAKANSYIQSISIGIIFNFTIFQINSIIRSTGNSFYPLLILITSNVLNAAISPIFFSSANSCEQPSFSFSSTS
mgnify:CR=1 FL=1